jgi:hypothetical protein
MDLIDEQCAVIIHPLISNPTKRFDRKGVPWKNNPYDVMMNGILWILLHTCAAWYDMSGTAVKCQLDHAEVL